MMPRKRSILREEGAMVKVGVAACHDVDQGSSPHAVNFKKN